MKFPKLKDAQVALLWSEINTGHVLDAKFNLFLGSEQEPYVIFETVDEALKIAEEVLKKKENIECVIYGKNQEVLYYLLGKK